MIQISRIRWQHVLPWVVSAGLLLYVFNVATDWERLRAETSEADDLPLFLAFTIADRIAFFIVWALLQAAALRRFVAQVPIHSIIAIRGGSELLRAVSNPLSDGAFFLGLGQLTGGRLEAVLAAALVPTICHFLILALQTTLALPFLPGSFDANRDVFVAVGITWVVILILAIGVRISATGSTRIPGAQRVRNWLQRFPLREIRPFFLGFLGLAIFDVVIQGLASRAFGDRYRLDGAHRPHTTSLSGSRDSEPRKFRNPRTRLGGPVFRVRVAGRADRLCVRGQLCFSDPECLDRNPLS